MREPSKGISPNKKNWAFSLVRVDGRKIDGVLRYKMPMIASEFSTHKRKNVF